MILGRGRTVKELILRNFPLILYRDAKQVKYFLRSLQCQENPTDEFLGESLFLIYEQPVNIFLRFLYKMDE